MALSVSAQAKTKSAGKPGRTDRDIETELHEREGSLARGWPALLMTLAMIAAAIFAFERPPTRSFPSTKATPNDILTNGLARQGDHYIIVGADGFIFTAQAPNGPWRKAKVRPQREATLTRVRYIARNTAIAVGHNGWILRSTDDGATWREVAFKPDEDGALFGIAGPFAGKLYAYGSYGQFLVSTDQGKHWRQQHLKEARSPEGASGKGKSKQSQSSDSNPFANFSAGGGKPALNDRHIYGMAQAADGSLFLVGESGLVAQSTDGGKTWRIQKNIYDGSFYGILNLPDHGLLIYGLGGHVFRRTASGETWQPVKVPTKQSLFAGRVTANGEVVLVGAEDTLLVSNDAGRSFSRESASGSDELTSVLEQPDGWMTTGTGGVSLRKSRRAKAAEAGH